MTRIAVLMECFLVLSTDDCHLAAQQTTEKALSIFTIVVWEEWYSVAGEPHVDFWYITWRLELFWALFPIYGFWDMELIRDQGPCPVGLVAGRWCQPWKSHCQKVVKLQGSLRCRPQARVGSKSGFFGNCKCGSPQAVQWIQHF